MARAEFYGVTSREGSQQIDQITSCSKLTNEIYGVELFPMVAAAAPLRDQLNGMRAILFFGQWRGSRPSRKTISRGTSCPGSNRRLLANNGPSVGSLLERDGFGMREPSSCTQ